MLQLGDCYERGLGAQANCQEALRWCVLDDDDDDDDDDNDDDASLPDPCPQMKGIFR